MEFANTIYTVEEGRRERASQPIGDEEIDSEDDAVSVDVCMVPDSAPVPTSSVAPMAVEGSDEPAEPL
ncbi:MAG: hypothetical protein ACKPKO_43820, partial [Candidatus Fonsibacter sp.]